MVSLRPGWFCNHQSVLTNHDGHIISLQVIDNQRFPFTIFDNKSQLAAIGRESGFGHGCPLVTGDNAFFDQMRLLAFQTAHPAQYQACPLPGHVGVVPFDPGNMPSAWLPARLHIKICPLRQFLRPLPAITINDPQQVCTAIRIHKNHPVSIARDGGAGGMAEPWCNRSRKAAFEILAVEDTVFVTENDKIARSRKFTTAVANGSAYIFIERDLLGCLSFHLTE